jgi:hypothetical protein
VTGDCHAGDLREPGGAIPPGHPTPRQARLRDALHRAPSCLGTDRLRRQAPRARNPVNPTARTGPADPAPRFCSVAHAAADVRLDGLRCQLRTSRGHHEPPAGRSGKQRLRSVNPPTVALRGCRPRRERCRPRSRSPRSATDPPGHGLLLCRLTGRKGVTSVSGRRQREAAASSWETRACVMPRELRDAPELLGDQGSACWGIATRGWTPIHR